MWFLKNIWIVIVFSVAAAHAAHKDSLIVFTYGQSTPTIVCAPLHVCEIQLEPGEVVHDLVIGDKTRWQVSPAISGTGETRVVHVMIKPTEVDLNTNMMITTDRRSYHIKLVSQDGDYATRATFHYPDSEKRAWEKQKQDMAHSVIAEFPTISVDDLHFGYQVYVKSGKGKIKPVRVFDDGHKVYIQMPSNMNAGDAPAFFALNLKGGEQLLNYRIRHGYYIVDTLFDRGVLVVGSGKYQDRVMIQKCANPGYGSCPK